MPIAKALFRVVVFLAALYFVTGPITCAAEQAETLSNQSVVELKQAGLSDAVIIEKVKASKQKFDLSVEGLKRLKEAGISDPVLSAMFSVFNATPNQEPLPETKPQVSPEQKKRDELKDREHEYAEKFDRMVAGGYTGNLSRKAYWKTKTDLDAAENAVRRAIETSDPKWQVLQASQPSTDMRVLKLMGKGFLSTPRRGVFQIAKLGDEVDIRAAIVFLDDPMRSPDRQTELRNFLPTALANLKKGMEENLKVPMAGQVQKASAPEPSREQKLEEVKKSAKYGDIVTVSFTQGFVHYKGNKYPIAPFEVDLVKGQSGMAVFQTPNRQHAKPVQIDLDNAGRAVSLDGFDSVVNQNWQSEQSAWVSGATYKPKKKSYPEHYVSDVEMFIKFKTIR